MLYQSITRTVKKVMILKNSVDSSNENIENDVDVITRYLEQHPLVQVALAKTTRKIFCQ